MREIAGNIRIECEQGDITAQPDIDAVVNAANAMLMSGGGVAGAVHRAAGSGLAAECRPLAPIEPGEAVITGAHQLPNRHVIHCLGPRYGVDMPSAELLASCYRRAIELADSRFLTSIAFPSISTGVFGYPMEAAADVAMRAVFDAASSLNHLRLVRFVLFDKAALAIHERALNSLASA